MEEIERFDQFACFWPITCNHPKTGPTDSYARKSENVRDHPWYQRTVWRRKEPRLVTRPFGGDCMKQEENLVLRCPSLCSLKTIERIVSIGLKTTVQLIGTRWYPQMKQQCIWIGWKGASGICHGKRKSPEPLSILSKSMFGVAFRPKALVTSFASKRTYEKWVMSWEAQRNQLCV